MPFDDFFGDDDFLIDPEDIEQSSEEAWNTGSQSDIFASGENQDIFSTKCN